MSAEPQQIKPIEYIQYNDNSIYDVDVIVEQNDDNAHEAEIKEEETTKTSTAKQVNINEI